MLKLGVLDQSHINEGEDAKDALANTLKLAQEADRLGFSRFWMSEHHASPSLAHSSPEVLIAHVAALTSRIRVGSGGIMLPHYSAYKVAENFRLLEALYPNRIDLGVGRAPGGMPLATRALQEGKLPSMHASDRYPQQIVDLIAYMNDALPGDHRFPGLIAEPSIETAPELWLLGSSGGTADLAAMTGASYAFAQFFGTAGGEDAVAHYKENFKPSLMSNTPKSLAAITVSCADTEEEAEYHMRSNDLYFLMLRQNNPMPYLPSAKTAAQYPYTDSEKAHIQDTRRFRVVGTPDQVKEKMLQFAKDYQTDELLVVSAIHNTEARLKSYRLLAETFDLQA
ncbi:LLM class flavin-dependent oxidoreductase [Paenibacillus kyungheensis]|uniref:LLM class flavin-dependent oxidoreductase n=1 Tax=Paenibacillus kyungheensis TaxID=1452732 RepID=A0AAX3LXV3_9BACL|nr:LLM class flavin-dependent oxidoreductase [Paenibacillus kyungheensis]WCT54465.1 LLM class flavin-dependent oxidoreductase [Paenibacillus kyungheensis]